MPHLIDTSGGGYVPLSVEPKTDREGNQRRNREGVPQWTINVLHAEPGRGKPEVIAVTVSSTDAPAIKPMQPAVFTNLRVDMYQVGDSAGLWFAADAVAHGSRTDQ
ncbi:hypothetical protein [Ruicaihuangia caeni]|uniref:hypothetical protein n=1 Tax=Ruicaihuangia caeni TaxID=3042517 RepID=UPI00338D4C89